MADREGWLAIELVLLGLRLLLGVTFAFAAISKSYGPAESIRFVEATSGLPSSWSVLAVTSTIALEWLLAAWLLAAVAVRLAFVATWVLLATFTGVLLYALLNGVEERCGCLGIGGLNLTHSIVRNCILMAVCVLGLVVESRAVRRLQSVEI